MPEIKRHYELTVWQSPWNSFSVAFGMDDESPKHLWVHYLQCFAYWISLWLEIAAIDPSVCLCVSWRSLTWKVLMSFGMRAASPIFPSFQRANCFLYFSYHPSLSLGSFFSSHYISYPFNRYYHHKSNVWVSRKLVKAPIHQRYTVWIFSNIYLSWCISYDGQGTSFFCNRGCSLVLPCLIYMTLDTTYALKVTAW